MANVMTPFSRILFFVVHLFPTAFTFTTFKHKLPPLPLKPLKSTADIRYSHFDVPPDSLSFRFSTYLTFQSSCEPANLTLFLRPHSLPVVAPDPVAVPPGVLILPDAYIVNVDVHTARPIASNVHIDTESLYDITYSRKDQSVSVDVKLYCPVAGMWFLGVFFLDRASEPKCSSWMFSEVSSDLVTNMDIIVLLSPTVARSAKPDTDSQRLPAVQRGLSARDSVRRSVPGFRSLVSSAPSNSWLLRNKRVFHAPITTGKRDSLPNTSADSPGTSFSTGSNVTISARFNHQSRLSFSLGPLEGRLYRVLIHPGTTDVDFTIDRCILFSPTTPRTQYIHPKQSTIDVEQAGETSICPVLVDAGRGVLPKGFGSEVRFSGGANNADRNATPSTRSLHTMRVGKTYRFVDLHDSSTAQYFYLRNLDRDQAMKLQMIFNPIFGCPFANPPEGTSSFEYHPQYKNKQFSQPSGADKPMRASEVPNSENAFSESVTSAISLLPWINPSWPNLTPAKANSFANNRTVSEVFVDTSELHNHALDRCSTLSSPSRVSTSQAFSYHFTYQPELNQYSSALHISPWNVMVIPLHLDSKLDTGGSLEISLQLNAFDLTLWVNETHSKSLPRQVILHACFAHHRSTSPRDFTDPYRCPAWLRLATDRGMFVSVAQAVSTAVSEKLLQSQPPHRSERPPSFDTSFRKTIDRSFFYLPYPPPGQWYLSLYAECYSNMNVLCSQHPASTVDVAFVIRSSPCLNHRCRASGEGASLPPSRILDPSQTQLRPLNQSVSSPYRNKRWHPSWLNKSSGDGSSSDATSRTGDHVDAEREDAIHPYEGLCVELIAQSLYTSTCACPPGRFGVGCMQPKLAATSTQFRPPIAEPEEPPHFAWHGYSEAALWLSLSNLAFLPSILLALVRRLWIPAVAYTYTLVFSALYHLCDTDVMNIPFRMGAQAISGDAMSFGGYALSKHRGYRIVGVERIAYHSAPRGFRFTSPACPLPMDVLSFCDFFGGFFSLWVTIVAACAMPAQYAQLAYVIFVLVLTITVQVARHSAEQFLVPCAFGLVMLALSWVMRSRQTGRLFPPVQWWILSLIPGLLCAVSGVVLFMSPMMKRDYKRLHSLWHILLGCSLIGMLPWPNRWRVALSPAVPRYLPLSCGGSVKLPFDQKNSARLASSRAESVSHMGGCCNVFARESNQSPTYSTSNSPRKPRGSVCARFSKSFHHIQKLYEAFKPSIAHFRRVCQCCWWNFNLACLKWDAVLELNIVLDPLVRRWPKLEWLLPYGYAREHPKQDTEYTVPDLSGAIDAQENLHTDERIGVPHSNLITLTSSNGVDSTYRTTVDSASV